MVIGPCARDGLVKHRDHLVWIGVSDYSLGIFVTELDKALEKLTWIRGNKPGVERLKATSGSKTCRPIFGDIRI